MSPPKAISQTLTYNLCYSVHTKSSFRRSSTLGREKECDHYDIMENNSAIANAYLDGTACKETVPLRLTNRLATSFTRSRSTTLSTCSATKSSINVSASSDKNDNSC